MTRRSPTTGGSVTTNVLSPEISQEALAPALEAFGSALGAGAVLTEEAGLREFRDPFAFPT